MLLVLSCLKTLKQVTTVTDISLLSCVIWSLELEQIIDLNCTCVTWVVITDLLNCNCILYLICPCMICEYGNVIFWVCLIDNHTLPKCGG